MRSKFVLPIFILITAIIFSFQNCTPISFSNREFAMNAGTGNGGGYEGKLFSHQDLCDGGLIATQASIIDSGGGVLWLIRDKCHDLDQWQQLSETQVFRSAHDGQVLGYDDRAFDFVPTSALQAHITAAFCVGNPQSSAFEAMVWKVQERSAFTANVYSGQADLTGNLNLMPPRPLDAFSTLYESAPEFRIAVDAYGQSALGVWPSMGLFFDDLAIGKTFVASSSSLSYVFNARMIPGNHVLSISYDNDYATPNKSEDRNLFLKSINVTSLSTGAQFQVDLSKMTAVDPLGAEMMPNQELAIWRQTTVSQSISLPSAVADLAFHLKAMLGTQASELQFIPAGSSNRQATPVSCFLQPTKP